MSLSQTRHNVSVVLLQKPMKLKHRLFSRHILSAAAGLAFCAAGAYGQSSDAIINKLVEKGILTTDEAKELRKESEQGFNEEFKQQTGLPDYVTSLKFNGDFRGRLDSLSSDNSAYVDRLRFRYRLRAGVELTLKDQFTLGFSLGSDDTGGSPLSNNTTLENDATKKAVWINTAFAKWTPIHDEEWMLSSTIGKMYNPLQVTPMEFDPDYTPEGGVVQAAHRFNDRHGIRFNGGAFILDEISGSTRDPFFYTAQAIWDAKWESNLESSLGVSVYSIVNTSGLTGPSPAGPGNIPNYNLGNTRDATGNLVNNYNPVVVSGSVTYKVDNFPLYKGAFPIQVLGQYMNNPAASSRNEGYFGGVKFGKSGKKGTWDIAYRYQYLEGDAWYEEVVDDDNVGYWQTTPVGDGAGGNGGMFGGTNVKGHLLKLDYSLTDALTLTFTGYFNNLIDPSPDGSQSGGTHLMADLMWKF